VVGSHWAWDLRGFEVAESIRRMCGLDLVTWFKFDASFSGIGFSGCVPLQVGLPFMVVARVVECVLLDQVGRWLVSMACTVGVCAWALYQLSCDDLRKEKQLKQATS